jgi:exonuclease VII large subunit
MHEAICQYIPKKRRRMKKKKKHYAFMHVEEKRVGPTHAQHIAIVTGQNGACVE